MLQGYIDDSGSSARGPVYVLAGCVSDCVRWSEFSDRWKGLLDREGIQYFKMREAVRLDGQFAYGWTPARRDQFVLELAELVSSTADLRVSVAVYRKEYNEFFGRMNDLNKHYEEPYFLLFWTICRLVMEHQFRNGTKEPCDFIFDQQGQVGFTALSWWAEWPNWVNPERAHLIGNPPIFRDDKKVMPLQAADLYAFLIRGRLRDGKQERWQSKAFMRTLSDVPSHHFMLTRERLLGLRASLAAQHIAFLGLA